uniref:Uncharacterized protein n=1 Tax=Cyprinus carpio TaxID=7962 RepID=A0A8C2ES73_CYPCA
QHRFFLPKQNGKDVILTGGNKGLGYETVRQLTNLGVYVIIGKVPSAIIIQSTGIEVCRNDKSQFEKVWKKKMHNQPREPQPYEDSAVMLVPEVQNENGFETHFDGLCSRVVSISSSAHYDSCHGSYLTSKTLEIWLHKSSCSTNALFHLQTANTLNTHILKTQMILMQNETEMCVVFDLQGAAAVSLDLEGVGGCWVCDGQQVQSSAASYDEDLQAGLWRNTCDLLGLQDSHFV